MLFYKARFAILIVIQLFLVNVTVAANTSIIHTVDFNLGEDTRSMANNKPPENGYVLIWADEFDTDGAVSAEKWHHQTQLIAGDSWPNGELQHYTNRMDNSFVDSGNLHITAKRESFTDQGRTKQFTSARLNSKIAFTYGRVDVRAKLPSGNGTWPAIWTLGRNISEPGAFWHNEFAEIPWPACGEIDIMEHWGNNPNFIHGSLHNPSSFGATVNTSVTQATDVSNTFHVYSMIWDEDQIQFLIDDIPFYTYNPVDKNAATWPYDKPQYLLLNVAMGGIGGAIDAGFTQSTMEVDYVRVFQIDEDASTADQPVSAAPIPTDNPDIVRAIFSDTYAIISDVDFSPDEGQSTIVSQVDIAGNNTLKYENLNFQSTDFLSNAQDISDVTSLHIDYWTCNATDLNVNLISTGPIESTYDLPITIGEWVSVDIPILEFPNSVDIKDIIQLKFEGNGTVFLDNIYFLSTASNADPTMPDTGAPMPTLAAEKVISIFSDSYSAITGINYNPQLGQTTVTSLVTIAGTFALRYENLDYQLTDFTNNAQDLTSMTSLHIDYWTSDAASLDVYLISSGPNEDAYSVNITNDEWVSVEIPLTEFFEPVDLSDIIQLKIAGGGTVYVDNIYFYSEAAIESQAITFEPVGDKTMGDDAFMLRARVDSGLDVVFSSPSNKINIVDDEVALLSAGRVTINADQEGNADFERAPTVSQDFCINPTKGEITVGNENSALVSLTSNSNTGNQWFLNGDPILNAVGPSIQVDAEGIYTVQISADDCVGEMSDGFSLLVTAIDLAGGIHVSVSPNPALDYIQILGFTGDVRHIDLFDLTGKSQQVTFEKRSDATVEANIQNLPAGLYLLKFEGAQGIEQRKIVKQ
jgi:beta-glucanase (GH16 family)